MSNDKNKLKAKVIRDKCIGAGPCVVIAAKVFQLDEEGIAYVVKQNAHDDETIKEAAIACPVQAIIVTDENGNQIYP